MPVVLRRHPGMEHPIKSTIWCAMLQGRLRQRRHGMVHASYFRLVIPFFLNVDSRLGVHHHLSSSSMNGWQSIWCIFGESTGVSDHNLGQVCSCFFLLQPRRMEKVWTSLWDPSHCFRDVRSSFIFKDNLGTYVLIPVTVMFFSLFLRINIPVPRFLHSVLT